MKLWAIAIAVLLVGALAVTYRQSLQSSEACLRWQLGFAAKTLEIGKRHTPLIYRQVYEETVAEYGRPPAGCETAFR